MKGVISFLVASVFLLVLVSSAVKISQRAPDFSYQPLVAMHLQEQAATAAFSDALADAAGKAQLASQASGADAPASVRAAVYLAALGFEAQMKEAGYAVAFWCGRPSEAALQDASSGMMARGEAVLPEGSLPLSNPACAEAFDVNLLRKKVRAKDAGFSLYSEGAGIGHALLLPDGFEGGIDG
ncbi:MAG: hypothetical protein NTX79_05090 [Candidatus Micrarchaeota archaeon]|nr:hypothetical protein [Candidatus Micrarchaeota archaeon]